MWIRVANTPFEVNKFGGVRLFVTKDIVGATKNSAGEYVVKYQGQELTVSRMIANAFVPNPEKAPFVRRLSPDKSNNCAANLAWEFAPVVEPRVNNLRGRNLTAEERALILSYKYTPKTQSQVAQLFQVDRSTISLIWNDRMTGNRHRA